MNDNMESILNVSNRKAKGRSINYYIQDNSMLDFILQNNLYEEKSRYITYRDRELIVQKFFLKEKNISVISFKNIHETLEMDRKLKRELINKGYIAKYHFHDIIGESKLLIHTKEVAKKLAKVDYTILIEGESGSGKELFASAIHNTSSRKEGPFLAVNFSALPEELVESELFGYEEGAFTGAKKGGKIG
ncbi:MAG: sigma 54-interacting transcriptional regulator, partial [Flavobacteriales bacterium]|nr:sigma 54-interacting transcriptional regulator [Flavobacteriales bacterium]